MNVMLNGECRVADMALVKEIKGTSVLLVVRSEEFAIEVDQETLLEIEEIMSQTEHHYLPVDLEKKVLLINGSVI